MSQLTVKFSASAAFNVAAKDLDVLLMHASLSRQTRQRIANCFKSLRDVAIQGQPVVTPRTGDVCYIFEPSETLMKLVSALRTGEVDQFLVEIENHRSLL